MEYQLLPFSFLINEYNIGKRLSYLREDVEFSATPDLDRESIMVKN